MMAEVKSQRSVGRSTPVNICILLTGWSWSTWNYQLSTDRIKNFYWHLKTTLLL